ncbi:NHL repeat-containing protein [Mitsuaria sp. 7]|uniref:NHL repeat-containing protein n=1 Tax=Mitsuaria sp. 7 TaxID=1658665 RepID=UPI0018D3B6D5|nr:NHL repeat-containing protein [Mitsuaria sp. 7]
MIGLDAGNVLVLRQNGGDDLSVKANGAFSFAAPVADGTTFSVTVKDQPLWQNCAISNARGTATAVASNVTVMCVAAQAEVTTLAGSSAAGSANGNGSNATFKYPTGVAVDGGGNVYVSDTYNNLIRKISPLGDVTTLAGSGVGGSNNGNGGGATFHYPYGVAVGSGGNLYVSDAFNNLIRKISPAGEVTTLAGSGADGAENGKAVNASFSTPKGIAVDRAGNVYVADSTGDVMRKITPGGEVSTLAGSASFGFANGNGLNASFSQPNGAAVDGDGNVYVADSNNGLIRKINGVGDVTTLAGSGARASIDGSGANASFNGPIGVAVDSGGNVYVADIHGNQIRRISPTGDVRTLAGSGAQGAASAIGPAATFNRPFGIAVDRQGNVYVADSGNNLIRKISPVRTP